MSIISPDLSLRILLVQSIRDLEEICSRFTHREAFKLIREANNRTLESDYNITMLQERCDLMRKHIDKASTVSIPSRTLKKMRCAVCDSDCLGRQWFNRDKDYGICRRCADSCKDSPEVMKSNYGVAGVNYESSTNKLLKVQQNGL